MLLVMVWFVIIASPILFNEGDLSDWKALLIPMETVLPLFIIFLLNRFLLVPGILFKDKNLLYFVSVFVIISFFTLGVFFFPGDRILREPVRNEIAGPQGRELPPDFMPPPDHGFPRNQEPERRGGPLPPFVNLLIFSILMVGFDTGLKISFRLARTEREKARLETENVSTQLAFLRNQVSPHFFMNTLNNIHAQIDIDTEEAKESLIRLSKLMRHLIYDSDTEKLPLSKELEFISNYIDLMSLRYSDKVNIELKLPDIMPDKSIPPLLFTSFVENAFKHGVSYESTSFVSIEFVTYPERLTMEIRNSNHKGVSDKSASGIGIENSRKRLDLLYGNKYKLDIQEGKDVYYVKLEIPI